MILSLFWWFFCQVISHLLKWILWSTFEENFLFQIIVISGPGVSSAPKLPFFGKNRLMTHIAEVKHRGRTLEKTLDLITRLDLLWERKLLYAVHLFIKNSSIIEFLLFGRKRSRYKKCQRWGVGGLKNHNLST